MQNNQERWLYSLALIGLFYIKHSISQLTRGSPDAENMCNYWSVKRVTVFKQSEEGENLIGAPATRTETVLLLASESLIYSV